MKLMISVMIQILEKLNDLNVVTFSYNRVMKDKQTDVNEMIKKIHFGNEYPKFSEKRKSLFFSDGEEFFLNQSDIVVYLNYLLKRRKICTSILSRVDEEINNSIGY